MSTKFRFSSALCFAGAALVLGGAAIGLTSSTSFAASVTPGSSYSVDNAPYSTAGKTCDPSRDGYHFIVNQLEFPVGAVIDGSDFGPINITFSDGSTAVAMFTDLSGNSTAHFLNSTVNQTGNFTITSATLTFPAGTDITGYGNFVISHPPCGTVRSTPTTTMAPTTTMTPTTLTPTTLTPTTLTPTTEVGSGGPTTTMTPTTMLGSEGPVPSLVQPTTTIVSSFGPRPSTGSTGQALPSTGSGELALLGAAVFGLGLISMALARRTHPTNS